MAARAWAFLLALAAASLGVGAARAHADYARSEPGAGAILSVPPAQVEIWFTQDMFRREGENWIRVTGPGGEDVHVGEAKIDDDDRRHMTVALQPDLRPGAYTVAWRTLSAEDGDDHEGSFSFTLAPQAQVTSTPMLSTAAAPTATRVEATAPASVPTQAATGVTTSAPPSATPAGQEGGGCGLGLLPVAGLLAVAWGTRRRSRPR